MRRMIRLAGVGVFAALLCMPVVPGSSVFGPSAALAAQVDINSASLAELEAIPGIGPAKAKAIIEYRATTPFASPDDLQNVNGIGPKLYERIKDHVSVGAVPARP